MIKTRLDPERLAVESFPTSDPDASPRGTVNGYACTDGNTCRCPTSYAVCGTGPATIYSCERTRFDCA